MDNTGSNKATDNIFYEADYLALTLYRLKRLLVEEMCEAVSDGEYDLLGKLSAVLDSVNAI